jgi:DNA-binding response OmpR family regulator
MRRAKILIVDDHPANLIALRALLDDPAYQVVAAQSGYQALAELLKDDFDLVLLDVQMPDMTGLETAAEIRKREKFRQLPIVFISAMLKEDADVCRGYELGACDYILKPFVPEILRAKVRYLLQDKLADKNKM